MLYGRIHTPDLGDLRERLLGAFKRGTVGQLDGNQKVALVLDRQETGRQAREPPPGKPDDHERDDRHHPGVAHHASNEPGVASLNSAVDCVEAAIEEVAPLFGDRRAKPQCRLRRLERHRVDRTQQRGRCNHQRELRVHAAGETGQKSRRQEHRHQHQRDADDRGQQHLHGADRGVMPVHAALDVVRRSFHHDDGVIDHDAD